MRTFISYAHEQRDLAERLALGLRNAGSRVFFDRIDLLPGITFDDRIRNAVERCDLFIFLVSKDSLREGAYTLSELRIAEKRWPQPAGKILPVLLDDTPIEALPAYLRAVSVLQPEGDPVADVLNSVARLSKERRAGLARWCAFAGLLLAIAAGVWGIVSSQRKQPIPKDISLTAVKAGKKDEPSQIRFDATVDNTSGESITVVELAPQTDNPNVYLSSSTEWFELHPGETKRASVEAGLHNEAKKTSFKWRMCYSFVNTLDLEMAPKDIDMDNFMNRYRKDACNSWREWKAPQLEADR